MPGMNDVSNVELLRFCKEYVDISPTEWAQLQIVCVPTTYKRGDFYLLQGEVCHEIAYVQTGVFRTYYINYDGAEINTEFMMSNDLIGDYASYKDGTPSQLSVQALEDASVMRLQLAGSQLPRELLKKVYTLFRRYTQSVYIPRLLEYQLILAEPPATRYQKLLDKLPELSQRVSQKHLSSYLHLTPETLSRIRRKYLDLNQLAY